MMSVSFPSYLTDTDHGYFCRQNGINNEYMISLNYPALLYKRHLWFLMAHQAIVFVFTNNYSAVESKYK